MHTKDMKVMKKTHNTLLTTLVLAAAMAAAGCSSSNNTPSVTPPTPDPGSGDGGGTTKPQEELYYNPVIHASLPDPTVIRSDDNKFYLYATEDDHNVPIYQSDDLVSWNKVGHVFDGQTRPTFVKDGGIWAPDINKVGDKYVIYFSMSVWGGEWECGIGRAYADSPEGPFSHGEKLFTSKEVGVQNSIDQFYIEDNGKKYLFWGSFHGIYGAPLTDDGLEMEGGAAGANDKKQKIAGDFMEGTYIYKHGKYYYLIGSNGSCCEGDNSTYRLVYGRSENLFGPYVTKNGEKMLDGHYEVLLKGNAKVAGPGHNAEITTDDEGNDWIIYHGYVKGKSGDGRQTFLDQVHWTDDDWPYLSLIHI